MAFFIDRDEIAKLTKIHKFYLLKILLNRNVGIGIRRLVYRCITTGYRLCADPTVTAA